jgi:hypothetical protein
MRAKVAFVLGLVALLGAVLPLVACGEEEGQDALESAEGEPLELGDLIYNVAITRFLNPALADDAEYLVGQAPEPPGKTYLGVFLRIDNENEDDAIESAPSYAVTDTSGRDYEPVASDSLYALDIGATVDADGALPAPDTTASEGVIQGSMLLFLVDDDVSANRPLELEINSADGTGVVELDI